MLDSSKQASLDETSARYEGWRIVVVCFLVATFGWGLGFYGQSVYVAELHRLHGWPASLVSSGTTFFYLFGALLVAFVSEAIRSLGPRNCLLAGVVAMAAAAVLIGQVTEPWQLYAANAMLAFGWAGTSLGIITNTLGLWFDHKRGMAISLALNGASFGGIIGVPLLVAAIGSFGFSGAMIVAAIVMGVLISTVIDRLNQRLASAISFVSQAVALAIIINLHNDIALIAACALFGFSVGNLITLPSLIVQREFDPRSFGVLISLITAINQVTYAFGPGVIGLLRDASGSYTLPFYGCIGVELLAAVLIMVRGRGKSV